MIMKGILLRVGCDQTQAGGQWNAPIDLSSWQYTYVPIPGDEFKHVHIGPCPTYAIFTSPVRRIGMELPPHLSPETKVHLDPDFESLTFGEPFKITSDKLSSRGEIINRLSKGDFIAFYAAFRPI